MTWNSFWKFVKHASVTVTLTACLLVPFNQFALAATHDVQEQLHKRTEQDIIEKFQQYKKENFTAMQMFKVLPRYTNPHRGGQLNDNVLQDGLNAVNFARYLAGLPDDITLDYTLAEEQQAGAVLMAVLGTITHFPERPAGMDESFYQLGAAAARTSNLSAGRNSIYDSVFFGYMRDNGHNNIDTVGHRRWILNPQMKKTMFGFAYQPKSYYSYYSTMYAFNRERSKDEVSFQYIAWPSPGLFPAEVLNSKDPWSITLNPEQYDINRLDEAYVTMERDSDNKRWLLDNSKRDKDGDFFTIDYQNFGINNGIIFRPSDIGEYTEDDVYHVTLHNLYTNSGQSTSLSYSVQLFNLQASFTNTEWRYAVVGQQLKFPINKNKAMKYTTSDPSIATVDSNGVVTTHKSGVVTIHVDEFFPNKDSAISLEVSEKELVPIPEWAKSSIVKANEVGLLQYNPYQQNLEEPVTRRSFVHYVVALLKALNVNIEESSYYQQKTSPFSDVELYSFNAPILWAYEQGIISGTGNGKFSPNHLITREQAATLLLNVYNYLKGKEMPAAVKPFADENKISGWARTSVKRAAELSIMGATSGNRFDPQGHYTDVQTIVTMLRLYQKFAK